jgi:CheY-like chemotaxis protein
MLKGGLRIDLALSDIIMPGGMTGFELARRVFPLQRVEPAVVERISMSVRRRRQLDLGGRPFVTPERVADTKQHLAHVERLGDIVVGALFKSADAVEYGAFSGDHDHGDIALGAKLARELQPVFVTKAQVQRDKAEE